MQDSPSVSVDFRYIPIDTYTHAHSFISFSLTLCTHFSEINLKKDSFTEKEFPATVNYYGEVTLHKRWLNGEIKFSFLSSSFNIEACIFTFHPAEGFSTHTSAMNIEITGTGSHK